MEGVWRESKKRGQVSSGAVVRSCTLLQSITVLASKAVWLRLDSRYPITKLVDGIGAARIEVILKIILIKGPLTRIGSYTWQSLQERKSSVGSTLKQRSENCARPL